MWNILSNGTVTIRFYANDTIGNINFEDVMVRKDIIEPTISIDSPNPNDIFGSSTPDYDLTILDANLDSIWYTLDGGVTNSTLVSTSGTIGQTMWDALGNGTVTIRFYVNDTSGNMNYKEVTVYKDIIEPSITINSPNPNDIFGSSTPDYDLSIIDANLDSIWYSLDGGLTNSTLVAVTGIIDQTMWSSLGNGTVTILFYANDTAGNLNYEDIIVQKDIIIPSITINSPNGYDSFNSDAPDYGLTVIDANLDSIWYTLDGGITNSTPISASGTIDQTMWNTRSNGTVTIRFYANDTLGNINFEEIIVRKDIIEPSITINSPNLNDLFGTSAPDYDITILDANLDSLWYELANGTYTTINTSFTLHTGLINQLRWDEFGNGTVIIRFYANDTLGNLAVQEVIVRKDVHVPVINIILPNLNQLCGKIAPNYNITVSGSNIDAVWYSLDDGVTIFTFSEILGTINQTAWDLQIDGLVTIKFYINNTLGVLNYDEITVIKDATNPLISLNIPNPNDLFSTLAPDFNATISDPNGISTQWYTLDGGITNYTFVGSMGKINQTAWELQGNGTVLIRFFTNDSIGNVGYLEIIVMKDIIAPIITVNTPTTNQLFGIGAPSYALSIIEGNLDMIWYTLNNGINNITVSELTGMINQDLWEKMPNGYITIKFYVNDTQGNIGFNEVIVVRDAPTTSPSPPGIPGYNILFLLGIVSTVVIIIVNKRLNLLN